VYSCICSLVVSAVRVVCVVYGVLGTGSSRSRRRWPIRGFLVSNEVTAECQISW